MALLSLVTVTPNSFNSFFTSEVLFSGTLIKNVSIIANLIKVSLFGKVEFSHSPAKLKYFF